MNIANNEEPVVKSENIVNNERYIEVPRGWNRCLENGNIVYFSPTQICLRSKEDIARYLISDRTCKCGLDCPLYIDKVFDFDASLPSRHFRLLKLENDHKTLCKETIKARFATLAQSQTVIKPEVNVGKPVVIKRKSEVSVPKKKNEASKSPSFDTLVSLADAKPNQTLQEEELKPKKPRKPVLHQKKSNLTVTSVIPMPVTTAAMVPNYQTVHSNMSPVLHSSFMIPKSPSVDAVPMAQQQQPTVSTGAVFGGSDHQVHSQNVGSLLAFPSTQLNASSFLAALSSAPSTISGRTTSTRAGEVSYVHPLHPFSTKSTAEQAQFGQKIAAFPGVPSQSNNVVYLSSSGLHTIANQNSNVNWPQAPGIPLSRLPQASPDKTSLEKPKGGFTMKVQENAPKLVFPYPNQAQNPATMTSSSASHVTSKAQLKHDLPQVVQKQLPVNTTVPGRSEPALPTKVHPIAISSNSDKPNNIRPPTNPVDPLNQPLQYCGIILQPGVVPGVQLAGATPRPSAGACKSQEQNPYSNLYTLQGLPYGNNVANPTVLGVTPNTVIPYFLGITQPGTPKPIVPATTATTTTKESSPTTYAAPVSTSAIAAAYSAFVSIAPASVTTSSFSQQLVNLVSNYNNPYWQQLLTQGASSNTLAYQLMQISQYASTRPGLPSQNTKTFNGKNTTPSYGQTKMTASTSKSSGSSSQESKPKIVAKNTPIPVPVTTNAVTTSGVVAVGSTSSVVITNTIVSTVDEGERRKVSDSTSMSMISKSCTSSTVTSCSATVASTKDNNMKQEHTSTTTTTEISTPMNSSSMEKDDFNSVESSSTHETSAEKTARTDTETGSNESLTENCVFTNSEKDICTKDKSAEEIECASSETNAAANDNSLQNNEKDDLKNDTSEEKEGSSASEIVVSTPDDSVEKMDCVSNEAVKLTNNDSAEKCEIVDSDMAASIHDDSAATKECTSNEAIEDSNTEEKSDCITSEVDDGMSCENKDNPVNPDLIDTITQNSGQEVCGDMKKDIVTPPNELSEVISTDEITNDSLNSETEEVSVTSVTVSKDSITIESEQLIDSSTSESQSIVTAEGKSTSECEVVKSPDAHTESSTVKSDSENVNSECNNTTLDLDNDTSHECSNLTLESSTNEERHVEVSEVDKESDCDVKTETLGNNDIGADLVTDTNVKTGAPEDSVPNEPKMETEDEASSSMSKKRKCDEECKVINKKEIKKQDVQNCKTESVLNDAKITKEVNQEMVASEAPVEFTIGDIVWAQARGLPSWPGKIVHERDVGNGKAAADIGKKWVMWFGDHNFSQVEVEKLKTLTDGLKTLDDKGKKRKYRGKRTRVGLEQAISEALEELDQRERLRSRQGPKAKKRRL